VRILKSLVSHLDPNSFLPLARHCNKPRSGSSQRWSLSRLLKSPSKTGCGAPQQAEKLEQDGDKWHSCLPPDGSNPTRPSTPRGDARAQCTPMCKPQQNHLIVQRALQQYNPEDVARDSFVFLSGGGRYSLLSKGLFKGHMVRLEEFCPGFDIKYVNVGCRIPYPHVA
jgi:hypothetical protein